MSKTIEIDKEFLHEIMDKLEYVCDRGWDQYASQFYGYGDLTYEEKLRKGDTYAFDLMKKIEDLLKEDEKEDEDE